MTLVDIIKKVQAGELKFRGFSEREWYAYSGCETDNPLIAEDDDHVYIIDGDHVEVFTLVADQFDVQHWDRIPVAAARGLDQ